MKVILTGATGFVGGHLLRALRAAGHEVVCLVRPGSQGKLPEREREGLTVVPAALTPPLEVEPFAGCEAAVHLVGIIREFPRRGVTFQGVHVEGTRAVVEAARAAGVRRFLHMSALGARPRARAAYHRTKYRAEEVVRGSGLDWTIFRPSLILGPHGEFLRMLVGLVKRRIVPLIGSGRARFAPVAVEAVAQGFVRALTSPRAVGRVYEVCGPQVLTYREMLDGLARALGVRALKVPTPVPLLRGLAACLDRFPAFPLTRDQLTMFLEGAVCAEAGAGDAFYRDLGVEPIPYEKVLQSALRPGA